MFSKHLKKFISESDEFVQNSEKYHRIRYVMDLVAALVASTHEYLQDQSKTDRSTLERQALLKEKERLMIKNASSAIPVIGYVPMGQLKRMKN